MCSTKKITKRSEKREKKEDFHCVTFYDKFN